MLLHHTPGHSPAQLRRAAQPRRDPLVVIVNLTPFGHVGPAIERLRMGKKLDPYRKTAQLKLEPWIVEAALDRLGGQRLDTDQQHGIVRATRTPRKVRWPVWWMALPS